MRAQHEGQALSSNQRQAPREGVVSPHWSSAALCLINQRLSCSQSLMVPQGAFGNVCRQFDCHNLLGGHMSVILWVEARRAAQRPATYRAGQYPALQNNALAPGAGSCNVRNYPGVTLNWCLQHEVH